jgi:hypothetical protein
MSYICHATGELVQGEGRELVPVKIRKVIYIAQTRPDKRSQYLQFAGQTEGWEVVQEVPVRNSAAAEFKESFKPDVVAEKEVRYISPKKQRPKQNTTSSKSGDIEIGRSF